MQTEQNSLHHQEEFEKDTYTFKRKNGRWNIELFVHNGTALCKQAFELVEGTDKLLDSIANGKTSVRLYFSVRPLGGSDLLELLECCAPPEGGGLYRLKTGSKLNGEVFWVCDLALIVFADMPEKIYIKRLPPELHQTSKDVAHFCKITPHNEKRYHDNK
jgi:hypothetical protein